MTPSRLFPLLQVLLCLFGGALSDAQVIEIEGNGVGIAAGDMTPSPIDNTHFGNADPLGGVVDHQFTIKNTGTSNLIIQGFQRLGNQPNEFTVLPIQGQFPQIQSLGIGQEVDFTVRFNPAFNGQRSAIFRFTSNSTTNSVYEFRIEGNGQDPAPEINLQGNGVDIPDGSPIPNLNNHTQFESTDVDSGSFTRTFTIQNVGQANLTVYSIDINGEASDQFAVTSPASNTVFPSSSTSFDITFDPDHAGTHLATVRVNNSDFTEDTYDFVIRGSGTTTSAQLTLVGNNMVIEAGDTTPSLDDYTRFESTDVGATSTRTLTIVNSGNSPLSIATIEMIGGNADSFSSSLPTSNPIDPGNTATIQVSFNPSAIEDFGTTLRINSNDQITPVHDVALAGTGGIFKLVSIEQDGDDALITFNANPTDGTYIYSIRHSTDMENWSTEGSIISSGGEVRVFRHRDGFLGETGYWHISEQTL